MGVALSPTPTRAYACAWQPCCAAQLRRGSRSRPDPIGLPSADRHGVPVMLCAICGPGTINLGGVLTGQRNHSFISTSSQNQNQLLPTPRHLRAPLSLFFGSPGKGKRKLVVKGGGLTATSTTAFAGASAFPHDPCWCAGSEEKKIQCTMKLCSETLVLADERSEHSICCPGRAPAAVVLSAEKHLVAFWSIRCPKNARDSVDWVDTTARIAAVPCSSCITDCIVTATIVGRQVTL